jgi:hypothetical protein
MKSGILIILFGAFLSTNGLCQNELQKITPLTPNAAALAKYGEIPVGQFTGIPNVSIPIHTIQSKELTLPLSLSYHAGGNKIEEISSWVGLGWSVNTIPAVSRSIRGLADDAAGGFFGTYYGMTMRKIQDSLQFIGASFNNYKTDLYLGETDPEADIFFFSLASKSGKFFWEQTSQQFLTTPYTNIKIEWIDGGFKITDDDGTVYLFGDTETSQISGGSGGPVNVTSWLATRMYNANKTDSIVFSYSYEIQLINSLNIREKNMFGGCTSNISVLSSNSVAAKPISTISFSNGYVQFVKKSSGREDLNGGYALDSINIYNNSGLLKKVAFTSQYRSASGSGGNCTNASSNELKRLFLSGVSEIDKNHAIVQSHGFLYDSSIVVPCRFSAAQDYWGFYNGKSSNTDLTPDASAYINGVGSINVSGANRDPDSSYSQFGILKRINYPTGGYTDFEYENNLAYDPMQPVIQYIGQSVNLEAGGITPPPVNYYADTFVIDNPPDSRLNGDNPNGGAFLSIDAGEFGCDLTGGSGLCADINIHKISGGGAGFWMAINANMPNNMHHSTGIYAPNGTYVAEAGFSQDPALWGNFFLIASWSAIDTIIPPYNYLVGGLRVKNIKMYDGLGGVMTRSYRYTKRLDTDTSSGKLFGTSNFIGYQDKSQINYINGGYTETYCYQIAAQSTAPKITHSGSFIGYDNVFEFIDSAKTAGMTQYQFSHAKDVELNLQPFPPSSSMEAYRGNPLQTTVYKKQSGNYIPVKRDIYEYTSNTFFNTSTISMKAQLYRAPVYANGSIVQWPVYYYVFYETLPEWMSVSKKTERLYNPDDTTKYAEQVTNFEYSPSHYQLAKNYLINSAGDTVKTKIYYPADLSLSGTAETARQALLSQNKVSAVLKQEQFRNSTLLSEVKTNYKQFGSMVMPEEVFSKRGSGSSESRVKFLKYNTSGKLISQQKTNDVINSYIWDYNTNYPVAEVFNADSASIAFTGFEADGKGGWTYSGSVSGSYFITGNKSYNTGGGNITKSGLTSTTYIVSYWGRNGSVNVNSAGPTRTGKTIGDWTYYEHEVTTTSITVSGSNYIDELRLYPKGARMTTYTYTPLVGMTSQCDATNRMLFYEYDSFNRLKLVKDEDGRILKKVEYKYQGTYQD